MTPIADMIEQMMAEGVPVHVILLAVRTAEQAGKSGGIPVDKTAEKRRAYDRERKAEMRKSGGKSGGNPRTPESAPSSLPPSHSQKQEGRKEEAKPKRRNGIPLPDSWRPSEDHYADAAAMGRTRDQVDAKGEEMRLWARANGHRAVARKLDWDATFTGWMRRDWGNAKGSQNAAAQVRSTTGWQQSNDDWRASLAEFTETVAAADTGSEVREPPLRLVSPPGRG